MYSSSELVCTSIGCFRHSAFPNNKYEICCWVALRQGGLRNNAGSVRFLQVREGVWFFAKGSHRGNPAFRQAVPFTVLRDGTPNYEHTGYHAINWHSGGSSSTSSLGCQTAPPNTYAAMRDYIYSQLEKCDNPYMNNDWDQRMRAIPYILIEEVDRRKGKLEV